MKKAIIFLTLTSLFLNCSDVEQSYLTNKNSNSELNNNKTDSNAAAKENFKKEWQSKFEKTLAQLQKNQQLWEENQILNYNWVIGKGAGGQYNTWMRLPVLIKVRDGEKFSIEKLEKGEDTLISRTDGFEDFDTIDKLFNFLRHELNQGRMLDIKYNKILGYPESITIQGSYEIHGYVNIAITKFEKTKG